MFRQSRSRSFSPGTTGPTYLPTCIAAQHHTTHTYRTVRTDTRQACARESARAHKQTKHTWSNKTSEAYMSKKRMPSNRHPQKKNYLYISRRYLEILDLAYDLVVKETLCCAVLPYHCWKSRYRTQLACVYFGENKSAHLFSRLFERLKDNDDIF